MILGKRHENLILALCALSLTVLGMIMIYSATNVMAGSSARYGFDPAYFFKRQVLFLAIGIAFAMGLSRLDHDFYRRRIGWIVGAAFLLLLLVYVPEGRAHGERRLPVDQPAPLHLPALRVRQVRPPRLRRVGASTGTGRTRRRGTRRSSRCWR